jgi:hypothetical protein
MKTIALSACLLCLLLSGFLQNDSPAQTKLSYQEWADSIPEVLLPVISSEPKSNFHFDTACVGPTLAAVQYHENLDSLIMGHLYVYEDSKLVRYYQGKLRCELGLDTIIIGEFKYSVEDSFNLAILSHITRVYLQDDITKILDERVDTVFIASRKTVVNAIDTNLIKSMPSQMGP